MYNQNLWVLSYFHSDLTLIVRKEGFAYGYIIQSSNQAKSFLAAEKISLPVAFCLALIGFCVPTPTACSVMRVSAFAAYLVLAPSVSFGFSEAGLIHERVLSSMYLD